jgi:hypothetical protein
MGPFVDFPNNGSSMAGNQSGCVSMILRLALLFCAIDLCGCYFANQRAFEHRVRNKVAVGMPVEDAIARLSDLRLNCTGASPAVCSRIRQSLMPYSCVERVRLYWTEQTRRVSNIEIPEIACAGL